MNRTTGGGPLAGIRVADFSQLASGPWCTSLMGDMGADVIKVESLPYGDLSRSVDSVFGTGFSSSFVGLNRNKRSVAVNLRDEAAREVCRRIALSADVLVENFRLGVMRKLGLGYDAVAGENRRLVYCSIKPFGTTGPDASRPAVDTVMQAASGLMAHTGLPGVGPVRVGASVGDITAANLTLYAASLALFERERSGRGQHLQISLRDGLLAMFANFAPGYPITGEPNGLSGPLSNRSQPGGIFRTGDGHVVVAAFNDKFWRSFCQAVALPELLTDPRFAGNEDRVAHRELLARIVEERLTTRPTREWVDVLADHDVPCSDLRTFGELLGDESVAASGIVQNAIHPVAGAVRLIGHPVRFGSWSPRVDRPAPMLGEHTQSVLADLGYSAAEQDALFVAGSVGETLPA